MGFPLAPVTPAISARSAAVVRLADPDNGFNPYLAAVATGLNIKPYTIDFKADSATFLFGKYDVRTLFTSEETDLPAISLYQGPGQTEPGSSRIVGSIYNGPLVIGLDVHLSSFEGESQTQFDLLVSATFDALVNTFNDMSVRARTAYTSNRILWKGDIAMGQPSRLLDQDTKQYLSTLPVLLKFYVAL